MSSTATIGDVVDAMERLYPASGADEGDPIGLVIGERSASAGRMLLAVDPVRSVVDEAVRERADLLLTHHPLLYRPVHSVAADTPKGRVVHDLIRNGVGLLVAHTNADSAVAGVSESLAAALQLEEVLPLVQSGGDPLDKITTFVPTGSADALVDALAAAGAGSLGDYDRCAFLASGLGTFRPGRGAQPAVGQVGVVEVVDETRIEMVLPRARRPAVVQALKAAHPYEQPAFDVLEMADLPTDRGTGRVGVLKEPMTLRAFADEVSRVLPATAVGTRVAGDLDALVRTIGVLGGSGDFMLDAARSAGLDVYVTSDLRHHPASESREHDGGPALVDVSHWAAEWTWLPTAARMLGAELAAVGKDVTCLVSRRCTDPWNHRAASPRSSSQMSRTDLEPEESL